MMGILIRWAAKNGGQACASRAGVLKQNSASDMIETPIIRDAIVWRMFLAEMFLFESD